MTGKCEGTIDDSFNNMDWKKILHARVVDLVESINTFALHDCDRPASVSDITLSFFFKYLTLVPFLKKSCVVCQKYSRSVVTIFFSVNFEYKLSLFEAEVLESET